MKNQRHVGDIGVEQLPLVTAICTAGFCAIAFSAAMLVVQTTYVKTALGAGTLGLVLLAASAAFWIARKAQPHSKDSEQGRFGSIRPWVIGAVTSGLVAMVFCSISAASAKNGDTALGLQVFGLGMLVAAAALAGGFLLGFLFGIPKVRNEPAPAPTSQGATASTRSQGSMMLNTNLGEISDWLTKALVGITLATSTQLYNLLKIFARYMGNASGWHAGGQYSLVILAFFGSVGFVFGWLVTAIYVPEWLEEGMRKARHAAEMEHIDRSELDAPKAARSPEVQQKIEANLKAGEPGPDASAADLANYAKSQFANGNFELARKYFTEALQRDPNNADIKSALAMTQAQLGQASTAIQSLSPLRSDADPSIAAQADAATVYSSLYQSPPAGYETAIQLGEKILSDRPTDPDRLWIHALLAAAYAQKYRYGHDEQHLTGDDPKQTEARANALKHAQEAVKDRRWKILLRQLCDPIKFGGSPQDNDLAVFANDPEFISLLELK